MNVGGGAYHDPYNLSSQHIAYYTKLDPKTGDQIVGQFLLARQESGKGNTLLVDGITTDEKGNVYIAGVTDKVIVAALES